MKETPIIMSGDNPAKILAGTKTMTRRVITTDLSHINPEWSLYVDGNGWLSGIKPKEFDGWFYACDNKGRKIKCPYGQVGDRLWVRETFCAGCITLDKSICYKADVSSGLWPPCEESIIKPSIHMPRWASRINLEITEVRVERLQEITEEDCIVEGCPHALMMLPTVPMQKWYEHLWDSLNAKRGYGWSANPWVWVISFKMNDYRVARG